MPDRKRVPILEQAVAVIEQVAFNARVAEHLNTNPHLRVAIKENGISLSGIVANADRFRRYLLSSYADDEFNERDFGLGASTADGITLTAMMARGIYYWTRWSRKIFDLTADFLERLEEQPLGDLTWNQVHLPYRGFAVQLPEPIEVEGQNFASDFLLVSHVATPLGVAIDIAPIPVGLWDFRFHTPEDKRDLVKLTGRRVGNTSAREYMRLTQHQQPGANMAIIRVPLDRSHLKVSDPSSVTAGRIAELGAGPVVMPPGFHRFAVIVAQLALMLSALPADTLGSLPREQFPSTPDLTAVTDAEQICTISTQASLGTHSHQIVLSAGGYELRCHWRRRHTRALPGKASIPETRRIWVKQSLVRQDRLVPGSLPSGGEIITDPS